MSKPATPDQIKKAITLRETGYSLACICEKTHLSPSTLSRAFKRHGVGKGGVSAELVEDARLELLNDGFMDNLKYQIASSILDDLAIAKKLREVLLLSLDELQNDTKTPAALKARSLAALATALKVTQEVSRKSLRMDSGDNYDQSELPELRVEIMTDDDIEEVKNRLNDNVYD